MAAVSVLGYAVVAAMPIRDENERQRVNGERYGGHLWLFDRP